MSENWQVVLSSPFTANDGDNRVLAMVQFHDELYVGVGRTLAPQDSANIYRLSSNGCKSWQKVTPPWSSTTGGYSMALLVYKDALYVGTDSGDLYRTSDGGYWTSVATQLPSNVTSLVEFNGCAYLAAGRTILRSTDGSQWDSPLDLSTLNSAIYDALTLAVFDNHLYAGAGLSKEVKTVGPFGETTSKLKGIQLWRTADGKKWSLFQDVSEPNETLATTFYPEHVHAMTVFKGHLYVGEYHGRGLYRTDGSTTSWQHIEDAISGSGSVFRLLPRDGKLYLGASHLALPDTGTMGAALLYASSDGVQWGAVPGCPEFDGTRSSVTSLMSHGGRLFVGTDKTNGALEVWECGPQISADAYEPNNTMAGATPVDLGTTMKKSSVDLTDLTLTGGDEDFFRITYREDEGECIPGPSPTWDIGAGLFAQLVPSSVCVHAVEEYCHPLRLKLHNAAGGLVGEYFTADALSFSCPSQLFGGGTIFLEVSSPDAKPRRYSLKVAYAPGHVIFDGKLLYRFWEELEPPSHLPPSHVPPSPPPPFLDFIRRIREPFFDPSQFLADAEIHLSELADHERTLAQAQIQQGLGSVALRANLLGDAERLLEAALAGYRRLGIRVREASVLRSLGSLDSSRSMPAEALSFFREAARIHREVGDATGLADDHMALARHHLAQREPARALTDLREAFELQRGFGDVTGQVDNLRCQSEAFFELDLPEPGVAGLMLAERLVERIPDRTARHEAGRRIALVAARLDADAYGRLADSVRGRAERVWRDALMRISARDA